MQFQAACRGDWARAGLAAAAVGNLARAKLTQRVDSFTNDSIESHRATMSPALSAIAEALEESDYWHKGERFDHSR